MLAIRNFDEVNNYVKNKRSVDFQVYFGDMDLPEKDKEKRIALAKKMEECFLVVMAILFSVQQYDGTNYELARTQFVYQYRTAISGFVTLDEYMDNYIQNISYQIIESVQNNPDDPFYVSPDRAKYLAENEANTSLNHQDFVDAIAAGKTRKKWVDIRDDRERPDHRKVGGTIKTITEPFLVGDSIMDYPKDTSYGANANQIVNCRCTIKYI